jgi:uncharacterized protein YaaR (DUF327 family)
MKVNETLNKPSGMVGITSKDEKRVADSKETGFQSKLRNIEGNNLEERVQELAQQITKQGEKLGKKVDIRELKTYKNMISEFLDEAVNNSQKFSKESFLDRRGRHKVYATVKKINSELERLTKEVLKDEKDNIAILGSLDDIRGLIIDLIM